MQAGDPVAADARFHEAASFVGIWILVFFSAVHTLTAMREILVPLLWALFVMMALLPATDWVERLLLKLTFCADDTNALPESDVEMQRLEPPRASHERRPSLRRGPSQEHRRCGWATCRGYARCWASIIVLCAFFTVVALFFTMIYHSALHMQHNWSHYEEGGRNLVKLYDRLTAHFTKQVPEETVRKFTENVLALVQETVSLLASSVAEGLSSIGIEMLMCVLYIMFWLSNPIPMADKVAGMFKRYIFLKTLASTGYALCVFIVLWLLRVDLSIVFGLVTFVLNFIPEVGPMIAMLLPVPVILFDGRMSNPTGYAILAVVLQLVLKFIFGNIVEVVLIERDDTMRLHPVVILFCVAFFGWIWGGTGMLLSVPLVACLKVSVFALPEQYADIVIMVLEGDLQAPMRFRSEKSSPPAAYSPMGGESDVA